MTITIEQLLETKVMLNNQAMESSAQLARWASDKRGDMGLLTDDAKNDPMYRVLSNQYALDNYRLREFNKSVSKNKEFQKANYERVMNMRYNKATS